MHPNLYKTVGAICGGALTAAALGWISAQSGIHLLTDAPALCFGLIAVGTILGRLIAAKGTAKRAASRNAVEAPRRQSFEPAPGAEGIVVVPGELTVWFHTHEIAGAPGRFVSAVTDGLRACGTTELMLTERYVRPAQVAFFKGEVGAFLGKVYAEVRAQQRIAVFWTFENRGLLSRDKGGIWLTALQPLGGLQYPSRARAMILLKEAEAQCMKHFGAHRVMARIGQLTEHFPFPTWNDFGRASVCGLRENETVLSQVTTVHTEGAWYTVEDQRLLLSISSTLRPSLAATFAKLRPERALAFVTSSSNSANAFLVWYPGQTEVRMTQVAGSDASCVTGGFLFFLPGAPSDDVTNLEDGHELRLTQDSWASLRLALVAGEPFQIPLDGPMSFELEWRVENS